MLLSFLTIETMNLPYEDVSTLMSNSEDRIAIRMGSATEDLFKTSKV